MEQNTSPFRPVSFGEQRELHEHHHDHSHDIGPNEQIVNFINSVTADLKAYNQKVATITHQEHIINN